MGKMKKTEIKILIVDDEKLARTTMHRKLNDFGYSNIQEAVNGRLAYNMLQEDIPDIIIADIVMPEMDGLQLLKLIREKDIEITYILLSGYEVFDYAKEALKYSASYYLLKPIDDRELLFCLQNAQKEISQRIYSRNLKEQSNNQTYRIQNALRHQYLREMIFQYIPGENVQKLHEAELHISYPYDTFSIILFRTPDHFEQAPADIQPELVHFCIENVAQEILGEKKIICHGLTVQKDLCLVCNLPEFYLTMEKYQQEFLDVLQRIKIFCETKLNLFTIIGVAFAEERSKLESAFNTAHRSVELQIIQAQKAYQQIRHMNEQKVTLTPEQKYQLIHAIKESDNTAVFKCLDDIFLPFFCTLRGQKDMMNNISLQLIMLFLECVKEQNQDETVVLGDEFDLYQEAASLPNEKETLNWLKQKAVVCLNAKSLDDATHASKESVFRERAQYYITENYQKSITLTDAANYFHFTPSYFSRLFKQAFKVGFIRYLIDYRINKAKQLLISSNMKVNEIGKEVGFNDSKHFYKIFKQTTGYQPSIYRDHFKGEQP
ncbi:MAG TPA: response regulator [Candidatus Eisenbergiella merdipullorum]|uniref:Stage 0 sporulation protein A homolog n=1 Tax=Candidatus Eisenbergiella merdipullorum TaxID=2838553 RepID=A0A9D2I9F8_9FIRM|nr:response regulator [Candidatus Eisenbergiella merdipullorum]